MSRRDTGTIKCMAKKKLLGNYGLLIGAAILSELIPSVLLSLFNTVVDVEQSGGVIVFNIAEIIITLLTILLSTGFVYMTMGVLRGNKVYPRDLFFVFRNHPDRYLIAGIIGLVIYLLPIAPGYALLTAYIMTENMGYIAPGLFLMAVGLVAEIILALRYSMVYNIMLDNRDYGVIKSYRESAAMMKGNKLRLLYLSLTFVGWILLGMLSFGIAYLWIVPYMNAAVIIFYFDITGEVIDEGDDLAGTNFDEVG